MKKVMGGSAPYDGGGGAGCRTTCYTYDNTGTPTSGTCSSGTTTVGNTTVTTCDCSRTGGTSCYNS